VRRTSFTGNAQTLLSDKNTLTLLPQPPAQLKPPSTTSPTLTDTAKATRVPKAFRALQHRNYQLYFGGQLISVAGTWMQSIAQGWLVYQLSHSEYILGVVAFAAAIPALIVTPFGGVIVDRVPKRALLVITQFAAMILAFILALLSFLNVVQVWHIVALAFGLGLVNAFDGPGRQAFVVEMVGRDDLPNAIAVNSMMFNGARVIGPAIGGVLLASVGAAWCFFINGLSFLAVIAGLLLMKLHQQRTVHSGTTALRQLADGLRYVFAHTEMFALLMLSLIFSMFGISYIALLPAFVDKILHIDATGYGALNSALGLGAVVGAFLVAHLGDRNKRGRLLTVANLCFPIVLLAFANNTHFAIALVLAFLLGVGFLLEFTSINTLLQLNVQEGMRGRVMSLYTLTFFGFAPFGNLAIGNLAELWGLGLTISISAVIALGLALIVLTLVPNVRHMK
jgi:MFS family permease